MPDFGIQKNTRKKKFKQKAQADGEVLLKSAIDYQMRGDLVSAEQNYREAIESGYFHHSIFSNLGVICKNSGRSDEAIYLYKKAIELSPNHPDAYANLGNLYKDLGQLDQALASTLKSLELKPDNPTAHMNLGRIYQAFGNLDQALASTLKSLELNPDNPTAHMNLGSIYKSLGNLDQALASTLKSVEVKPDNPDALSNLGGIYSALENLAEAKKYTLKALSINPNHFGSAWNLQEHSNTIIEAEQSINRCLSINKNHAKSKIILAALKYHQGDKVLLDNLLQSEYKNHPCTRSINWVSDLPYIPILFFNRWSLFDHAVDISVSSRPFYEFGVWRAASFKYLIKPLKRGYGFDTFEGLPEDWHNEKKGTYSANGNTPQIEGGVFIKGKFEETLPNFFSQQKPLASIINFDADLYSSTLCALENSKSVIDKHTILIFDEFIINDLWEQDEYKALNEFCTSYGLNYEVIAVSYFTKQVAVKIVGLN